MPKRSRQSQRAKLQRASGKAGFDSGFIEDAFEKLQDPDFELDLAINDNTDSDEEIPVGGFIFSVVDEEIRTDSESEEWESEVDGEDDALESDEENYEDDAVIRSVEKLQEHIQQETKKPRTTFRALGTYSGAGRSMVAKRKKDLREAARGSAKIDSFFTRKDVGPSQNEFVSENDRLQSQNYDMHPNEPSFTMDIPARSVTPIAPSAFTEPQHCENSPGQGSAAADMGGLPSQTDDLGATATIDQISPLEWLDATVDDEREPEKQTTREIVVKLIKEAKIHKSFPALFKLEAVKNFLDLLEKFKVNPRIRNPRERASLAISRSIGKGEYFARQIRRLSIYIGRFRALPTTGSGKHHAHPSLLNDERIAQAVRRYLTVVALGEITPLKLQKQVNDVIIPALGLDLGGQKISERCAQRWLHKLGYAMTEVRKGIYVDGHERPDVVEYRKNFLEMIKKNERLRYRFDDETLEPIAPTLGPGDRPHIPIHQDESIFRANELRRRVWAKDGKTPLRKKGQGKSTHISGLILEICGRLRLTPEQIAEQEKLPEAQRVVASADEIIYPGKNSDGWWNAERLIAQIKRAIPLFEKLFPGAVAEFFFDQSTAHGTFSEDALNAKGMNVNPGGKQRRMHDTIIPQDNPNPHLRGTVQKMNFDDDLAPDHPDYQFKGQPKGMRRILEERGLWEELVRKNGGKALLGDCEECKLSQKAKDKRAQELAESMAGMDEPEEADNDLDVPPTGSSCCMRKVLSEQADFRSEKPLLQLIIERAGHKCYFLPKFHCELNPIEMVWGWAKLRYRSLADGSFKTAKTLIPELYDACETKTIRAFYRKTWRYMDAYSMGLNARQAEYAVKKYRSHRRIGAQIMMDVNIMNNSE